MKVTLPDLPYKMNALEPHVSARTLEFHYGKHHRGYVEKVKKAIKGTDLEGASIEEIIIATQDDDARQDLFNNAAQVWNHTFYWQSMAPDGGGKPHGALAERMQSDFDSIEQFQAAFKEAASSQFGSGWVWLIFRNDKLAIASTTDAQLPDGAFDYALISMDVWEHAYYLDYQNQRGEYVDKFLKNLINWDFAAIRFETQLQRNAA